MKTMPTDRDTARLEAAADWMLRLRDETAREEDLVRWVQWCEADPRNQQAFDRAQEIWELSGGLSAEVVDGELIAARRSRAWLPRARKAIAEAWRGAVAQIIGDRPDRRALALGAAAATVVVVGAMWLLRAGFGPPTLRDEGVVAVTSSELVHEAQLSDGSKVELAAESAIAVHYTEEQRALELRGGEAYFSVAKAENRPFVVTAGALRVRAVGTAFNVRRADERVVVTVTEGTVDVFDRADGARDAAAAMVRVLAGNQVSWDARESGLLVTAVDPAAALGWREGRLIYNNEPLGAVIADLNRYSKRPVVVEDEAVKALRFSGTLLTKATDEWLHALPGQFAVQLEERDGGYVITERPARRRQR